MSTTPQTPTEDEPTIEQSDADADADVEAEEEPEEVQETEETPETQETTLLDDNLYTHDTEDNLPEDITREFNPESDVSLDILSIPTSEVTDNLKDEWEHYVGAVEDMGNEPIFDSEIVVDHLSILHSHFQHLIDESRLVVTQEGLFIRSVNAANVVQITAWIDADDFEHYNVEREGVFGVGWNRNLGTMISQPSKGTTVEFSTNIKTPGEAADSVEASFETEFELPAQLPETFDDDADSIGDSSGKRVECIIDDGIKMRSETISPKSLRAQPDTPDLDQSASLSATGVELKSILRRVDNFGDHVSFIHDESTDAITIEGDGDTTTIEKTYNSSDDIEESDKLDSFEFQSTGIGGEQSRYNLSYLLGFLKGPRKTELRCEFTVEFGEECPVTINRSLAEESFIKATAAPRIQ